MVSKVALELMDNWFSSPDLYSKLYNRQTDAMVTLCQNRECLTK